MGGCARGEGRALVQQEAAARPKTICFRFSVRSEEKPGSPGTTEGGRRGSDPAGPSRPWSRGRRRGTRAPRGLEASEGRWRGGGRLRTRRGSRGDRGRAPKEKPQELSPKS